MDTKNRKRKNRCISATDSEWQAVTEMARVAGMPISRFVLQRVLTPSPITTDADQSALPETAQWDQLHAVLTLMQITEENMTRRGDTDRLEAIRAEVEKRINAWQLGF
ncbi:hypothetical protein [Candidatus Puniceispirillum marinum]|uniref:Uncharacterized protein n=1 Tax=Puniceispirillum marinum (strain IMCC1322) TaxID=488538 RepID=D5BMF3_PUNMI|nr:hypothetical protein [Candidatus Puniceispirillum marinum]ADE39996.1 hypothetical protein SAR116_1753 [Candidatus Puniceispirillum marinum IMCC1322]